jgi:PAS domain-containing protein
MFLGWGPELTCLYKDAFISILGRKHPSALGQPSMAVWSEAREVLEPMFERVFAGDPVSIEDFSLGLDRQGHIEEAHFEFAYTPARGEDGTVEGLFGACIETTARVMAERAGQRTRSDSGDYSSVLQVLSQF